MARGVAGNKQDFSFQFTDLNSMALVDAARQAVNSVAIALVAVNIDFVTLQNSFVPARVVAVMMGVQNGFERNSFLLDSIESRVCF